METDMAAVKRLVLDVLKPHQPNALEFANAVADLDPGYRVDITVTAVDEKTETTVIAVEGDDLDFAAIERAIAALGGSIHSIDEVSVYGQV
jgi:hypothetical protein